MEGVAGNRPLVSSSFICIGTLFSMNAIFFAFVCYRAGAPPGIYLWYFITTSMLHLLMLLGLLMRREDLRRLSDNEPLRRINISCWITLSRTSLTPTILFLMLIAHEYSVETILVVTIVLTFLTDLLDGKIARHFYQETHIGQYLDSFSDYCLLTALTIAFRYQGFISLWFFWIVLTRLLVQWIGIGTLLFWTGRIKPHTNLLGKASIFTIMALYGISLLVLFFPNEGSARYLVNILESVATAIVLPSILVKIHELVIEFKKEATHF